MENNINKFGFFNDLGYDDPINGTLRSQLRSEPQLFEKEIVGYLKNGIVLMASPGAVQDIVSPENGTIASGHILTDGKWLWPEELAHYVENYHIPVDHNFLSHMKENNWKIPEESQIDLDSLYADDTYM